jgi:hypothetical protein
MFISVSIFLRTLKNSEKSNVLTQKLFDNADMERIKHLEIKQS